jgi:acyl-coenzyme A thioesterase PaaI-like protein
MTNNYTYGLVPKDQIMARTGLEFLSDMVAGKIPQPPICEVLGFHLAEVKEGFACFEGLPEQRHYNPIGTVHGGFATTLLDSALGCAIFSTLARAGPRWN